MSLYDSEGKNLEALNLLEKAKALNVFSVAETFKQEAIVLIRLSRMDNAINSLELYKDDLESKKANLGNILNPDTW